MAKFIFLFLFFALTTTQAFEIKPEVSTTAPLFLGIGASMEFTLNWGLDLQFGFAPEVYTDAIASYVADSSGNSSYDEVIKAAFKNNQMWKIGASYKIDEAPGWKAAAAIYGVNSSGSAGVDKVLGAATGRDYTNLKSFLIAAGKDPNVQMKTDLKIFEISGIYTWNYSDWNIEGQLGLAKVAQAEINLKTRLPNFEASANGKALLRGSEADMEDIIEEYGITPVIGISANYHF